MYHCIVHITHWIELSYTRCPVLWLALQVRTLNNMRASKTDLPVVTVFLRDWICKDDIEINTTPVYSNSHGKTLSSIIRHLENGRKIYQFVICKKKRGEPVFLILYPLFCVIFTTFAKLPERIWFIITLTYCLHHRQLQKLIQKVENFPQVTGFVNEVTCRGQGFMPFMRKSVNDFHRNWSNIKHLIGILCHVAPLGEKDLNTVMLY